ncbi:hypothetical protein EIP91_007453, partial [Steccherinum ochraceum]
MRDALAAGSRNKLKSRRRPAAFEHQRSLHLFVDVESVLAFPSSLPSATLPGLTLLSSSSPSPLQPPVFTIPPPLSPCVLLSNAATHRHVTTRSCNNLLPGCSPYPVHARAGWNDDSEPSSFFPHGAASRYDVRVKPLATCTPAFRVHSTYGRQ